VLALFALLIVILADHARTREHEFEEESDARAHHTHQEVPR
jgi:hypothetical protein